MKQAHLERDAKRENASTERDSQEDRRLLAWAESEKERVAERLREVSTALVDANQALAQVPLLEHRIEELREENVWLVGERARFEAEIERLGVDAERLREENAEMHEEATSLRARLEELEGSRSWRLLAPLRRLRALFR